MLLTLGSLEGTKQILHNTQRYQANLSSRVEPAPQYPRDRPSAARAPHGLASVLRHRGGARDAAVAIKQMAARHDERVPLRAEANLTRHRVRSLLRGLCGLLKSLIELCYLMLPQLQQIMQALGALGHRGERVRVLGVSLAVSRVSRR